MDKKEKREIGTNEKIMLVASFIGVGVMGFILGCKQGAAYNKACVSRGIEKIWKVNPDLQKDMWDAIDKVK